jgi:hypothetical protein
MLVGRHLMLAVCRLMLGNIRLMLVARHLTLAYDRLMLVASRLILGDA